MFCNTLQLLKEQCREIFDPRFFHQSIQPRALIHGPKPFRIWLRIRLDIQIGNRQYRIPRNQRDRNETFVWSSLSCLNFLVALYLPYTVRYTYVMLTYIFIFAMVSL
jgi:hypothetical protein